MDVKDILTLSDDNEYLIAGKATYEHKVYLYLVDINNNKNIKFCYLDNDEVVEVEKEDLSEVLLLKLLNTTLNALKSTEDDK